MASRLRKSFPADYKGTIVPTVSRLINQCKGMDRPYRIISEEEYKEEINNMANSENNNNRMTIVVNIKSGEFIKNYWG